MKKRYLLLTAILLSLVPAGLHAQDLESGYFLGGNPYAFRLNPAFQSERNMLSLVLGGTGTTFWSNLGASTFLYPDANGYLYTFLNDRVSASEFLGKINQKNVIGADARVNLLTIGFWAGRRFYTLDFNIRSLNSASMPRDVFRFMKDDMSGTFDFSGLGFRANELVEAAFGWSKNYGNAFNVGFRVKALVGIAEMEMALKRMQLSMSGNKWEVQAQGYLHASSPSFYAPTLEDGTLDYQNISFDDLTYGPAGYGGAIDLGASWNVLPELTLSASILDLGAIRWNREINGITPEISYSWEPAQQDTGSDDWEDELSDSLEELVDVIQFKQASGNGAFGMMPVQLLLGAEYRMPFYDRLSVGALYMGRYGNAFNRQSARLSLNWNPLTWMSMSTGATLNRLGESFSFAFNLHPAGINLLFGCDYIPVHCVPYTIEVDDFQDIFPNLDKVEIRAPRDQMKLNFYLGLNLAFGRRRLDPAKRFIPKE
ncbi:MAG: hypothetical protein IKW89_01010 [Bacteroidales bacterium]|nr:hypothetical protein [Bacteroidales bacterium]